MKSVPGAVTFSWLFLIISFVCARGDENALFVFGWSPIVAPPGVAASSSGLDSPAHVR